MGYRRVCICVHAYAYVCMHLQVDAELEAYHTSNAELDSMIGALRAQLNELQTSLSDKRCVRVCVSVD